MNAPSNEAPGAPGIPPRWTSSAKEGIGTAYHTSSRLWFTVSHSIVNEIYYPTVDTPNTRDIQLLVTDGETFFHEEKRDLIHEIRYPEKNALFYELSSRDPEDRYEIKKELLSDPHQPVFLMRVRIEIKDESLRDKLKVYLLISPHLEGAGYENSAAWSDGAGQRLLHAWKNRTHLVAGAHPGFLKRSVGYVGTSDGWQDLNDHFVMDWEYEKAEHGNLAMMAELDFFKSEEGVVVGVGFGDTETSATANLLQSLALDFDEQLRDFVAQWQRVAENCNDQKDKAKDVTGDKGSLYRLSRAILLAHEDKTYQGALIASLSIPWGDVQDDGNEGGYHLVWPRDMLHSALALLAAGHPGTPQRALTYLATIQSDDGDMPQNCWLNGDPYWPGKQLDEIAAPLILAWHVAHRGAAGSFEIEPMMLRGASRLMLNGPVTAQERWEENSGYSPSTLASAIAALVAAADVLRKGGKTEIAEFIDQYADWMASHLEDWCVTTEGTLLKEHPRHYVRITPASPGEAPPAGHVNSSQLTIANGGGTYPTKEVVGGDFLSLVRYGIRPADDPIIRDSLVVIDETIKVDLPYGPGWQRYNHDGYGQERDGSAFDGGGFGGCWPLLAGERAMYELSNGENVTPMIAVLEESANEGGMFPEQVWQFDDLPGKGLFKGGPAGSAMPLCWAHAEYLNLVRSAIDGVPFDRILPAYERYVENGKRDCSVEIWTLNHPVGETAPSKPLRIMLPAHATVRWSSDAWQSWTDSECREIYPGIHFMEIPAEEIASGRRLEFTFKWADRWEGRNFTVTPG